MKIFKNKKMVVCLMVLMLSFTFLAVGCGRQEETKSEESKKKETITIAGGTWESSKVNAEIAGFIMKNGYGYKPDIIMASSMVELQQHAQGEIDIRIENWTKTYDEEYTKPVADGTIIEVNEMLKENAQGLYVPTYLIKGDIERNIKPLAPDLKSIADLPKYWELFKDPEAPSKGRIIGAPTTWSTDKVLPVKVSALGFDKYFNYFRPGSGTALDTVISAAYQKGDPVVAYYWEPTWLLGKYDMTLLEDEEFSEDKWNDNFSCEFPADRVTITVHKNMLKDAPEVVEFLKNYQMSSQIMNGILAYMQDNNAEPIDAAIWYLKNNKDTWNNWIPTNIAEKVNSSLN